MKNKGFTLIELLSVILILGIISMIAVPTVSSLISEFKKKSFEITVTNLVADVEDQCNIAELKDEDYDGDYKIENGKISPGVNIKGKLPENGTILTNNNCLVTDVDVSNEEFVAAVVNGEVEVVKLSEGNLYKITAPIYVDMKK